MKNVWNRTEEEKKVLAKGMHPAQLIPDGDILGFQSSFVIWRLKELGIEYRVECRDGVGGVLDASHNPNRLNLTIEKDRIISFWKG